MIRSFIRQNLIATGYQDRAGFHFGSQSFNDPDRNLPDRLKPVVRAARGIEHFKHEGLNNQ